MQLKSILNSIFHQDSSVLKLLADKKVYESEQSPKKINSHITTDGKQDLLDLMDTSDNFFIKAGNWLLFIHLIVNKFKIKYQPLKFYFFMFGSHLALINLHLIRALMAFSFLFIWSFRFCFPFWFFFTSLSIYCY